MFELNSSAIYFTEDFSPELVDFERWKTIQSNFEKVSNFVINGGSFHGIVDSIKRRHMDIQGFQCTIDNDKFHARTDRIKPLFEEARTDLGKEAIDKELVKKVRERIAPGLTTQCDSLYTVPIIAPRQLLILNGAEDPCCPIAGLETLISRCLEEYAEVGCPEKFQFVAEEGVGHRLTMSMVKEASDWFDKILK